MNIDALYIALYSEVAQEGLCFVGVLSQLGFFHDSFLVSLIEGISKMVWLVISECIYKMFKFLPYSFFLYKVMNFPSYPFSQHFVNIAATCRFSVFIDV